MPRPPVGHEAAVELGLPHQFYPTTRVSPSCNPKKYQLNRRIERAKDLLASSEMSVTAIAESCGFATLYAFSRQFSRHVGTSPLKYRSEKLAQL